MSGNCEGEFAHIQEFFAHQPQRRARPGRHQSRHSLPHHPPRLCRHPPAQKMGAGPLRPRKRCPQLHRPARLLCPLRAQRRQRPRAEMLRISDFLHKLGICLHFQSDAGAQASRHLAARMGHQRRLRHHQKQLTVARPRAFHPRRPPKPFGKQDYANLGDELLQLMEKFQPLLPHPWPRRPLHRPPTAAL
jgi:hypothetical protein